MGCFERHFTNPQSGEYVITDKSPRATRYGQLMPCNFEANSISI
jgi:hypothetical protein